MIGLLAKSAIDTLPAALLLGFYWKYGKLDWRKEVRPLIPFFATGIAAGLFTAWVERAVIGASGNDFQFSLIERSLIAGRAFWFYLGKLAWPADLIFSYPRWRISASVGWQYFFPALALGLVALLAWLRRRWSAAPLAAVLYFAGTLFPALGFISIFPFRYSFVADHFQYLASVGPMVLAAAGVTMVFDSWIKKAWLPGLIFRAALAVTLGFLTWQQCGMYAGAETLYRTTISRNPQSWLSYNNLGRVMEEQGRTGEAAADYRKAIEINPASYEARLNLGDLLAQQGQTDDAMAQFREAYQVNPGSAAAHYDLGNILLDRGKTEEAIGQYREALRIKPENAPAHFNLGVALFGQGRTDEAAAQYREALRIEPAYTDASVNLGIVLMQQGRAEEGTAQFRNALRINPESVAAHDDLGKALLQLGRKEEAVAQFYEVLRLDPVDAEPRNRLGILLLQMGRNEEAASQFRAALKIKPSNVEAHMNLAYALTRQGENGKAIAQVQEALNLQPSNPSMLNQLAWMLATAPQPSLRNGTRALEFATRANQLTGGANPLILRTLAAAHAAAGEFPIAVQTAHGALQLAEAQSNTALADALRGELKYYEASRAYEDVH